MDPGRRLQRLEELCGGALRALAADPLAGLRGRRLVRAGQAVGGAAPHLLLSPEDGLAAFRGASDGHALRLRRTDAALHAALAPAEPAARRVFDLLEQYRVESLVPAPLAGVAANLRLRHAAWSTAFVAQGLLENEQGLLVWSVAQVCRSRITGEPMDERTQDLVESTRMALAPRIGHALARLRRARGDQAAFATAAREIALVVAEMLHEVDMADDRAAADAARARRGAQLARWFDGGEDEVAAAAPWPAGDGTGPGEGGDAGYRVFTRAYDRTVPAESLVREALLRELRTTLDRRIAAAGINVPRLARELAALLGQPQEEGFDGAQEEGRIDGRMLARLIASPTERRLFRQPRLQPRADVAVAFLIDCSGSMKQHVERISLLVDVAVRALEQVGVATEVLGFTTGAWNGGRARRDWQRAGRPPRPGRLNEVCQIVFKAGDRSWRQARPAMAALLKPDLFREGIDGEAVAWACERVRGIDARRRIVVALSDGSPMDTATAQANGDDCLDVHLQQVVARESRAGDVEIVALGVGLDLSPFYPRSRVFDLDVPPGRAMFADLQALLAPAGPPR